jgi:hypothetical protein
MAAKTAALARDTVNASILADIHHQESQAPLIVWDGLRIINAYPEAATGVRLVMRGLVRNIGFGPAAWAELRITMSNGETITVRLGAFAVGDTFPEVETRVGYGQSPIVDRRIDNGVPVTVEIFYRTAYGRERVSTYREPITSNQETKYYFESDLVDLNRDERLAKMVLP